MTARLRQLREYRWSSYRAYAGYAPVPAWLAVATVLGRASRQPAERVRRYRRDVQDRLRQGGAATRIEALRDAVAIGGAAFTRRIRAMGMATGLGRETAAKRQVATRSSLAEIIAAVARVKGERWEAFRDRHGDTGAGLVLRLARRYTGLTLRELGAAMGGMDYAAVSIAIQRQRKRVQTDAALAAQEQAAVEVLNVEMSPQ